MVKLYKIQSSKKGNLIRMPTKVSEYYERHEEKNGVIWFRPSSKPKVKLPAEAMAAPAPVRAPAPTQPVVIVPRKPVVTPKPMAPPAPVRPVAAPPVPKLPVYLKELTQPERGRLLIVMNRLFGREGVIRANALPEGMGGLIEAGLTRGMLFKYLDERVKLGFVTATGSEFERVWRLFR